MNGLFDATPFTDPLIEAEQEVVSATRRLTARNNEMISAGQRHPATLLPFAKDLGPFATCGTCVHAQRIHDHDRHYIKCDIHRLGMSASASSDIRAGWPPCVKWEQP